MKEVDRIKRDELIRTLRSEGLVYRDIAKIAECSLNTVFHAFTPRKKKAKQ